MEASLVQAFADPLQHLQTKPLDYSTLGGGAPAALVASAARPEFLAELTFYRGALSTWLQAGPGPAANSGASKAVVPEPVIDALAALAARLHGLVGALAAPPGAPATVAAGGGGAAGGAEGAAEPAGPSAIAAVAAATAGLVRPEWTSALSSKPQRLLRLDSLPQELAMVYATFAAAVRQSAHQRVAEAASSFATGSDAAAAPADAPAAGGGPAGGAPTVTAAAVSALRRAAGVYSYLAEQLLPELGGGAAGGAGGDRPLELLPASARCMQFLCLAEAQGLMAAAAAAKGMGAGTQRALHAGAVVLLRSAEEAAREAAAAAPPGLPLSDRLVRLLAAACAGHSARAYHCVALERQKDMELGEAEACCEECQRLLEGALRRIDRSDPPTWAEALKALQAADSRLLAAVHKDRLSVTYQSLPKQTPDATANAAVRVVADPFRPTAVVPLAPTAEQAKGGCTLM